MADHLLTEDEQFQAERMLEEDIGSFFADPLGYVMYNYPWDTDPSIQIVPLAEPWRSKYGCEFGPDVWQCEFLDELGEEIKKRKFDGRTPVDPLQFSTVSGHGIGKSTLVAFIANFIHDTRPFARGTVTATTYTQLETKTWPEIAKWQGLGLTAHWSTVNTGKGNMKMYNNDNPDKWFCSAQSCKKENSDAFQGQHAANSTSYYIFDEASGVDDKIDEVSEWGLTDGEPMKFLFGNGTKNTGFFRESFRQKKHRYITREIDSRDVYITNKDKIKKEIADHGFDDDRIKVRVRGMFPSQSANQFNPEDLVQAALGKHLPPHTYNFAPKIITCDPAWTGEDELVIGLRQGLAFSILATMARNDNDVVVANMLMRFEDEHEADAVFIDLGYGTGIYSVGKTLNRSKWQLVAFGGKSHDPGYLNKRAEMYGLAKQWLKEGGALPDDKLLFYEATQAQTVARVDGLIQIESKEDMKKRGLTSGNRWDSLIISFAHPVNHTVAKQINMTRKPKKPYDIHRNLTGR